MDQRELIIESLIVLMGDCSPVRKKAAELILRALVPNEIVNAILKDIAMKRIE